MRMKKRKYYFLSMRIVERNNCHTLEIRRRISLLNIRINLYINEENNYVINEGYINKLKLLESFKNLSINSRGLGLRTWAKIQILINTYKKWIKNGFIWGKIKC